MVQVATSLLIVALTAIISYVLAGPGLWLLHRRARLPPHGVWMPLAVVALWWSLYAGPMFAGSEKTQFWNIIELAIVLIVLGLFSVVFAALRAVLTARQSVWLVTYWALPLLAVGALRLLTPPIYE